MSDVWAAVSPWLTAGVLIAAAAWLLRTWLTARIKGEVETLYASRLETHKAELRAATDKELEHIRARFEQERAMHAAATSVYAAAHSAATERRLKAVEEIWHAAVVAREAADGLMLLFDYFRREELATVLQDESRKMKIGDPTEKAIMDALAGTRVDRLRPFVDEPLWALFYGYRALLWRILFMLRAGRDEGEVRFWLDDGHTSQILASLLDASEFDRIKRLTAGGIGEAQRLIEAKIVEAARKTVSGESSSEAAWEQARLVMQLAQESESATR